MDYLLAVVGLMLAGGILAAVIVDELHRWSASRSFARRRCDRLCAQCDREQIEWLERKARWWLLWSNQL